MPGSIPMQSTGKGASMITRRPAVLMLFAVLLAGCQGTIPIDNGESGLSGGASDDTATLAMGENLDYIYDSIDTLFAKYVTSDLGLVDYGGITADPLLKNVLDSIEAFDLSSVETSADSLAFWINAYNIVVIYYLEKDFDRQNQSLIGFPLFSTPYTIAGEMITLDQLEKFHPERIKKFNDPRTHFAVVCGALGCPPLLDRAFRGDRLYAQLDERARSFLNDSRFNRPPKVSSLFTWYTIDYEGFVRDPTSPSLLRSSAGATVADFIQSYLAVPAGFSDTDLEYLEYDWNVNDWEQP